MCRSHVHIIWLKLQTVNYDSRARLVRSEQLLSSGDIRAIFEWSGLDRVVRIEMFRKRSSLSNVLKEMLGVRCSEEDIPKKIFRRRYAEWDVPIERLPADPRYFATKCFIKIFQNQKTVLLAQLFQVEPFDQIGEYRKRTVLKRPSRTAVESQQTLWEPAQDRSVVPKAMHSKAFRSIPKHSEAFFEHYRNDQSVSRVYSKQERCNYSISMQLPWKRLERATGLEGRTLVFVVSVR